MVSGGRHGKRKKRQNENAGTNGKSSEGENVNREGETAILTVILTIVPVVVAVVAVVATALVAKVIIAHIGGTVLEGDTDVGDILRDQIHCRLLWIGTLEGVGETLEASQLYRGAPR